MAAEDPPDTLAGLNAVLDAAFVDLIKQRFINLAGRAAGEPTNLNEIGNAFEDSLRQALAFRARARAAAAAVLGSRKQ